MQQTRPDSTRPRSIYDVIDAVTLDPIPQAHAVTLPAATVAAVPRPSLIVNSMGCRAHCWERSGSHRVSCRGCSLSLVSGQDGYDAASVAAGGI